MIENLDKLMNALELQTQESGDLTELPTDKLYNLITNITEQIKIGMPKIEYEVHGTGKILDWDTSIIKLTPLE
jgi:hypothetical protein